MQRVSSNFSPLLILLRLQQFWINLRWSQALMCICLLALASHLPFVLHFWTHLSNGKLTSVQPAVPSTLCRLTRFTTKRLLTQGWSLGVFSVLFFFFFNAVWNCITALCLPALHLSQRLLGSVLQVYRYRPGLDLTSEPILWSLSLVFYFWQCHSDPCQGRFPQFILQGICYRH